ncbi:MAG TPA: beta-ketoacyl-[acyl-carrier-protein] synthase family protein [Thermoanaerobaculia bacterium]|jgi:3-oxoacyl-[acyl-carrier-protein] synthase II|nr:beta-ketoacyl-[acyl-carrier-protein] synthase family protein [Thermoanaerobaculia bacterium]
MQREGPAGTVRRVAVSGIGAVCGLGWGVAPLWAGLRSGRPAFVPVRRFDHSQHRTHLASEVGEPPAELARVIPGWRRLSVADRFAVFAASEAVERAGLLVPLSEEAGVYFGSSTGGMYESELFFSDFLRGRRRARLSVLASQQVNGPGDAVARRFGVAGPVETLSSACASGALALAMALDAVRSGEVEVAVAGGADSLCQLTYAGFNSLRSVDEAPCRPFRACRAGMSFGEGAAALVLEPLDRVLARGAEPLAELAGAGASCDAHHMTAPDPTGAGAAAALSAALADAGLGPEAVDFINVHGTGTPLNDAAEWRALQRVFGEQAERIPLVATKALVGHLLGCSGALEAVATILCLQHGELHPAWNGTAECEADPELPVSLVTGEPLPLPAARTAVSTSLAFGGSNAALVFSRWTDRSA